MAEWCQHGLSVLTRTYFLSHGSFFDFEWKTDWIHCEPSFRFLVAVACMFGVDRIGAGRESLELGSAALHATDTLVEVFSKKWGHC